MPFRARYAKIGAGVSGASAICDASVAEVAWWMLSQSSIASCGVELEPADKF